MGSLLGLINTTRIPVSVRRIGVRPIIPHRIGILGVMVVLAGTEAATSGCHPPADRPVRGLRSSGVPAVPRPEIRRAPRHDQFPGNFKSGCSKCCESNSGGEEVLRRPGRVAIGARG